MRGNGLEATSYVALVDVDPRVADVLLERLRDAGVAAYAVPCEPAQGVLLEVRAPVEPRDRLHVDESAVETARELIRAELSEDDHRDAAERAESDEGRTDGDRTDDRSGPTDDDGADTDLRAESDDGRDEASGAPSDRRRTLDEDAVFAEIVAAYDAEPDTPVAPWPTSEDTDESEESSTDSRGAGRMGTEASGDRGAAEPATAETDAEPDEEGYVPPPPPPLPSLDPLTKLGWVGLVGGPLLLVLATVAGPSVPDWFIPVGVVGFLAGFVVLVTRMRGGPPDESDDGAVV